MSSGVTNNNIRHRPSLRGLKLCSACGEYNGVRRAVCRNERCESRKVVPPPCDPIRIVGFANANSAVELAPDNFFGLSISNMRDEYACDNIPDFPSSPTQLFGFDGGVAPSSAITTIAALDADQLNADTHLELTDCNIELMDQFELTDHIDLPSDDMLKLSDSPTEFANAISILSPSITFDHQLHAEDIDADSSDVNTETHLTATATALPTIELPTIAVVKKCPIKTTALVNEVKTRKFPRIPAKRALIVNDATATAVTAKESDEPQLAYSAWLEYVIETINQSIQIGEQTNVTHNFHVHEEMFAHFSKTFTNGNKWRMPNAKAIVQGGPHKGLTKYTWHFTVKSVIQRIFTTKNIAIQLMRFFEYQHEQYVPYIQPNFALDTQSKRRIYSKVQLHSAQMLFNADDSSAQHNVGGMLMEWLPNVYPKSHFGLLTIQFTLHIKHPSLNVC